MLLYPNQTPKGFGIAVTDIGIQSISRCCIAPILPKTDFSGYYCTNCDYFFTRYDVNESEPTCWSVNLPIDHFNALGKMLTTGWAKAWTGLNDVEFHFSETEKN